MARYPKCPVPNAVNASHNGGRGTEGKLYEVEPHHPWPFMCGACCVLLKRSQGGEIQWPPAADVTNAS